MAYYPYQNQYYTQLAQQMPQQMPQQNVQNNGLIWVQGIEAAKSYMVAPNTTVLLMDSESQRFYLKSSDSAGMPMLRVFEYVETTQNTQKQASGEKNADLSGYATKAEFDAFRNEINDLLKHAVKNDIVEA